MFTKMDEKMKKEKKVAEIEIPSDISIELSNNQLILTKGNKKVVKIFKAEGIAIEKRENKITITSNDSRKKTIAVANAIIAHVKNMIVGLQKGYIYRLKVIYAHFPMNIQRKGKNIEINNFIGGKKQRIAKIIGDTLVEIKGKDITVSGSNKEDVGQTVANMELASRAKNKDLRVFHDGIYLYKKEVGTGK